MSFSILDIFWLLQIGFGCVTAVYTVTTGAIDVGKDRPPADEQKRDWLQIRKRPVLYHLIGVVSMFYISWLAIGSICWGRPVTSWSADFIGKFTSSDDKVTSSDTTRLLVACSLVSLHTLQCLYESVFIIIHSGRSVNDPFTTVISIIYQVGVALSVISHGPALTATHTTECFNTSTLLRWNLLIPIVVFILASVVHRKCHTHLANLRRNKFGHITTTSYKQPKLSGLFSTVTCPQFFTEVIVYCCVGVVLGTHSRTWWLLTAGMFTWKYSKALATNNWYKIKFDDYPRHKKSIIPFLL